MFLAGERRWEVGWGGFLVNRRNRANKYQIARNSIYYMAVYSY